MTTVVHYDSICRRQFGAGAEAASNQMLYESKPVKQSDLVLDHRS